MAVPKKKTSKSKRNMRRSHHALSSVKSMECTACGERKLAHHICSKCGDYKGRIVIDIDTKI